MTIEAAPLGLPPQDLNSLTRRAIALRMVKSALASVDPVAAVNARVRCHDSELDVDGQRYDLRRYQHVYVVGAGKGSAPMAQALEDILGDHLTSGIISVKYGYTAPTKSIVVEQAGHPIPDERSVRVAEKIADLLRQADADDLIICLLSGGGSALLVAPVPGVSLADKRKLTNAMLRSGASINEINTIRKHLSQIKGGGMVRLATPATVVSLVLSDVLGDPLDVIASGPTVPDPTTFAHAWEILNRYDLVEDLPASIATVMAEGLAGRAPESPKPGDPIFNHTQNVVVASNGTAVGAALDQAKQDGLSGLILSTLVEGEAREVARVFSAIGRELVRCDRPIPRPAAIIAGGETTVTVKGHGRGGRNQEFALSAAIHLDGEEGVTVMAVATDGSDGPTNAAGVIVDGTTVRRAQAMGLNPRQALMDNDSHTFFQRLGDLIVTGPTNTNVGDLYVVIAS